MLRMTNESPSFGKLRTGFHKGGGFIIKAKGRIPPAPFTKGEAG